MRYGKSLSFLLTAMLLFCLLQAFASAEEYCDHYYVEYGSSRATCTRGPRSHRRCVYCGHDITVSIGKPLGHNWGGWTTTQEPTCSTAGKRVHKCKRCGTRETKSIEKLPHTYSDWSVQKRSTCTETGTRSRRCLVCNYVENEVTEKLPHPFTEWDFIVEATDHSSGVRHHVCSACGYEETETYDPVGTLRRKDKGDAVMDLQSMLVCRGYMKRKRLTESFDSETERAVKRCQEAEGLTVDGIAWPQTLGRLGHNYSDWTIVSIKTDFSIGRRERTCSLCGYTDIDEDLPSPLLRRGDKGDDVKALQRALNDAGYNVGKADGDYGGKTERAVKSFEKDHGLLDDGIAWPGVIARIPGLTLAGAGSEADDKELSLIISFASPQKDTYMDGEHISMVWTLSCKGSFDCSYWCISCDPGQPSQDRSVLAAGTLPLKAYSQNKRSGQFDFVVHADDQDHTMDLICRADGIGPGDRTVESNEVSITINIE